MRTLLFFRKYRRFHGGHLKVWHYFNHVRAAEGYDARVMFDIDSSWDRTNPWSAARDLVVDSLEGLKPDALFVAGRDWQRIEALGLLDQDIPILNLIQHVRHAGEWSIQSRYLPRKAIRICVSQEVADAVQAAGSAGRTVVIPNGVDVPIMSEEGGQRDIDLMIAGLKQPEMARQLAERLQHPGRSVVTLLDALPREEFLDHVARANVTTFLPNIEEGFYLPGLEGMALGTLVVCPDSVGNRAYLVDRQNGFLPPFEIDAIAAAAEEALGVADLERDAMIAEARETAMRHSPESERAAFGQLLNNLDALWESI